MKDRKTRILENRELAPGIFRLVCETDGDDFTCPDQFAMVSVPEKFLRRPISIADHDEHSFAMIYKVVGEGTDILSQMKEGETLEVLTGLGNGYDIEAVPDGAAVIGGGIGIPPMYGLAKALKAAGKQFEVILGYNRKEEIFLLEEFEALEVPVTVMTADGSYGQKGFVTDAFDRLPFVCACGPTPMLKALDACTDHGFFSLEARMGCGFGACMGCSIKTTDGSARVCKNGPVFDKEVIQWESL